MQPFVINSHGRMVFPANFLPELDFTVITDLDHLAAVIRRDFEAKAPSGTDILRRVEEGGHYSSRYELMRDVALNLFWTNRFAMTMYDKRPTRWRDVPRHRDDVYLPLLTPWQDAERKVAAVERQYAALPATWDGAVEDRVFAMLFDVLRHRRIHATELPILLLARIARAWLGPMPVEAHVDLLEGLAALCAGVGGEGPPVARGHRCVGRLSDAEEAAWRQAEHPDGVELGTEQDHEGTEVDPGQQAQDNAEQSVAGARALQLVSDQVGADQQQQLPGDCGDDRTG